MTGAASRHTGGTAGKARALASCASKAPNGSDSRARPQKISEVFPVEEIAALLAADGHTARRIAAEATVGFGRSRYLPLKWLRKLVRKLNLRTIDAYIFWANRDGQRLGAPAVPQRVYKTEGWQGWSWFLGTAANGLHSRRPAPVTRTPIRGTRMPMLPRAQPIILKRLLPRRPRYLAFPQAEKAAQHLWVNSVEEYCQLFLKNRLPHGLPVRPDLCYGLAWRGWEDFLLLDEPPAEETLRRLPDVDEDGYVEYAFAQEAAWNLKLKSVTAWRAIAGGLHPAIPRAADEVYRGRGFVSWEIFLGL